jgi:hypothetical protein
MTITATTPATGTGTGTGTAVPVDRFRFGDPVKIGSAARDITGAALGHDELTGTVDHPYSGERFYLIGTDGGTEVTVPAGTVSAPAGPVPVTVPVSCTLEVFGSDGWRRERNRVIHLPGTQDALDAFVIVQAGKDRKPNQRIRVSAVADGGRLVAWREETGWRVPEDRRSPRVHATIVLVSSKRMRASFGSRRAAAAAEQVLRLDPVVADVVWDDRAYRDCA